MATVDQAPARWCRRAIAVSRRGLLRARRRVRNGACRCGRRGSCGANALRRALRRRLHRRDERDGVIGGGGVRAMRSRRRCWSPSTIIRCVASSQRGDASSRGRLPGPRAKEAPGHVERIRADPTLDLRQQARLCRTEERKVADPRQAGGKDLTADTGPAVADDHSLPVPVDALHDVDGLRVARRHGGARLTGRAPAYLQCSSCQPVVVTDAKQWEGERRMHSVARRVRLAAPVISATTDRISPRSSPGWRSTGDRVRRPGAAVDEVIASQARPGRRRSPGVRRPCGTAGTPNKPLRRLACRAARSPASPRAPRGPPGRANRHVQSRGSDP